LVRVVITTLLYGNQQHVNVIALGVIVTITSITLNKH